MITAIGQVEHCFDKLEEQAIICLSSTIMIFRIHELEDKHKDLWPFHGMSCRKKNIGELDSNFQATRTEVSDLGDPRNQVQTKSHDLPLQHAMLQFAG